MQKTNQFNKQLQQLVEVQSPKWLPELVPLIWQLVAAVRSFFHPPDQAPVHGAI